jgi:hypothetical protein
VLEVNNKLVLAAYAARERLRSLMGIAVTLGLPASLPPLTEKAEPPPPGESPPHDPSETVVLNPQLARWH